MNEETRLTLELEQARKRLRQARKKVRLARREQTLCIAEVNMLDARLVREKYGNKPFKKRLPRLSAGRTNDEKERYRRNVHHTATKIYNILYHKLRFSTTSMV